MFVGVKSFKEIRTFAKHEQERLLSEAWSEAYPGWRTFIPVVAYSFIFSGALALCETLRTLRMIPRGGVAAPLLAGAFVGVGVLFQGMWQVHRMRPYLLRCIERLRLCALTPEVSAL